ncbi:hypothetical protein BDZ89DRAFT_351671 [Hymenopellis radicata]|nr:hypothetical protein BDZ89DRAFT_351671 [Hymenopellis radicata]
MLPFIVERWNWRNQLDTNSESAESYGLQYVCQGLCLDLETLQFEFGRTGNRNFQLMLDFFSDDSFCPLHDVRTLSMDIRTVEIVNFTQKLMTRFSSLETLEISNVDYDVAAQLDISQVKHLRFNITLDTSEGSCTLWEWHLRALENLPPHSPLRSIHIQIHIQTEYSEPFDVAFPQPVLWDSLDRVLCAENLSHLRKLTFHVVYSALTRNKDAEELKCRIEHWLLVRCLPLTYKKYFLSSPPKGLVTFRYERPAPII